MLYLSCCCRFVDALGRSRLSSTFSLVSSRGLTSSSVEAIASAEMPLDSTGGVRRAARPSDVPLLPLSLALLPHLLCLLRPELQQRQGFSTVMFSLAPLAAYLLALVLAVFASPIVIGESRFLPSRPPLRQF